jgi:hypothetical protein
MCALDRIGRKQLSPQQQVTCTVSSESLKRNFSKEQEYKNTWNKEQLSGSTTPRATDLSAASLAKTFSCISQPSRPAVSAVCKKVKPFNLTLPRDRRAGRRKTFERHKFRDRKEAILNKNRLFSLSANSTFIKCGTTPRRHGRLPCDAPSHTC